MNLQAPAKWICGGIITSFGSVDGKIEIPFAFGSRSFELVELLDEDDFFDVDARHSGRRSLSSFCCAAVLTLETYVVICRFLFFLAFLPVSSPSEVIKPVNRISGVYDLCWLSLF